MQNNSNSYIPKFNFLVIVLRVLLISFLLFFPFFLIFRILSNEDYSADTIIPASFICLLFGYISLIIINKLVRESFIIKFHKDKLTVFFIFQFRNIEFNYSEIKGYSNTTTHSKIKTYPTIILYLKDSSVLDLISFNYFDFSKLEEYIKDNFTFLGNEPENPKLFIGRKYFYK
jgi:hypothetical protein